MIVLSTSEYILPTLQCIWAVVTTVQQ